ncbi:hypothetical protein NGC81_01785 [Staphylococcus xylosus]|uniref:hypothetical protein n=1 Tax=Staphylococcus xylosus TaxID=1288 RepID=UPI002DBDEAB1|nr:hypothetical protein [Staphylococcus xylosus]MEB7755333.1 hypothetical protein [Staphylococcus xylosus]
MFVLNKIDKALIYKNEKMMLETTLLKDYNIHVINRQVMYQLEEIETMYGYSMSHTATDDTGNLISVSCGVEKLILMIDDKKSQLESFKRASARRLKTLNYIVGKYSPRDQQIIKQYMKNKRPQPDNEVVQKLRKDLYKREKIKRDRRNLTREFKNKAIMEEHINELNKKLEAVTL